MKEYYGNHLGICINNDDPENRGRVQVFIPHIMPALYEDWNELGEDIRLECVGNNLPNGLSSKTINKLTKILPWAEAAMPIVGNSVAGSYNPETGNFNLTNTPEAVANSSAGGAPFTPDVFGGSFTAELNDPNVRNKLFNLMEAEVGGQGTEAQLAFVETVRNRAAVRGVSIDTIISDTRYYEPYQTGAINRAAARLTDSKRSSFSDIVNTALAGSNITNGATHNASAGVAASVSRGGFDAVQDSIVNVGGETFYSKTFEQNKISSLLEKTQKIQLTDPATGPDASAAGAVRPPFFAPEPTSYIGAQPDQSAITQVNAPTPVTVGGIGTARRGPTLTSRTGATFASGILDLTLPGGTTRSYQFNNGGFGAGAIPAGDYTVTNPRIRDTNGMVVDGVGYSFDLNDVFDPNAGRERRLLRIHPDGGATGTLGCLGIVGDAATQRQFYEDMKLLVDANGGNFNIKITDDLPESGIPGASSGSTPTLDAPSQFVKNTTGTAAVPLDTTGMAQGMFAIPGPGAMLWVFFREGNPLFPVYFAASYGATEWQSAQKASSPAPYGPQENSSTSITNQAIFRPNNAGAITFTGAVDAEKDSRAVRMAHANGGYFELHPYGSVHYSPNEHLEQVAGTSYKYCLNREEWTQGDSNKVVIGNQWVVIGNPSQANIETIEKLTEKVKQINAEMLKN